MQNKAKFRKVKLNVNKVLTKDYEKMDTWWSGTKQSQTNPNKAKFKKAKMNVTSIITLDYENKPPIRAPKKQSQTSKRQKPMQTSLSQRIMKNTAFSGPEKTNPNQTQCLPAISVAGQSQFQRFSRLDFDNMLNYSQIWESFGNRILRRTAKCGPTAAAGGQLTKDKYFALEKAVSYKGKGLIMKQQMGGNENHLDHGKHCSGHNCSHGVPNIDEKTFFGMSRRDFLMGLGAAGVGAVALSSCQTQSTVTKPIVGTGMRMGSAIRVQPALVYSFYQRREATSWRSWGGLHNQSDVDKEIVKINKELQKMSASADFPMDVLPLAKVTNGSQATAVKNADCDVIVVFAAGGAQGWLETIVSSKQPTLMFLRHRSGPVYLWYEIAHPRFLRKNSDDYKQPGIDVWDIVVDDYDEILWRLRALYGLKNTLGTRIVAIGGPGGWGAGSQFGPRTAREIWKLDIRPVEYKELEPMIKKVRADDKAVREAEHQTNEYLADRGVSLHCDRKFLVNAFLLNMVFKQLMEREDAPAITVHHCMGTIMPMSQTTACMPLTFINDEGLMAFCESDFVVIPSGILMRYISGKPSFLQNPNFPHKGITTHAHCTAPRRMNGKDYEPVEIHTHYESDYGAAPKVNMRKGQIITIAAPSFDSKKWIGYRAKIIDHPFYDICRSQLDIEIDGDWKKLLEDKQGFHTMISYGDYLREIGYALKKVGIEWQDLTNGSTT